jgi:hypothetical protein
LAGNRALGWLRFETQETLENQVCIASFDGHLDGSRQPVDGVLVPMPPYVLIWAERSWAKRYST